MRPPDVVPTPTTNTGLSRPRATCSDRATSPVHAWPSDTSTNALAFGDGPWLRVTRGRYELACNFSDSALAVPVAGESVVVVAGSAEAEVRDGAVALPAKAAAVVLAA